jgi:hypothetical protein
MIVRRCGHSSQATGMETNPVFNSDEHLIAVLAKLEECRTALAACGSRDTAHLVSVAVLDLRMKLNKIGDAELKLLCDEIISMEEERAREAMRSSQAYGVRPLLRVVK